MKQLSKSTKNENQASEPTKQMTPALKAVLDHQAATDAAEQEVQRLQSLKTIHQERLARADELDETLTGLYRQKEDLLADIEAGEDKGKELSELNERYKKANEQLDDPELDRSDSVLAGMSRKIERAQADVAALKAKGRVLVRLFLMEQAEAMGAEYAEAALKTVSLYRRLYAMNRMLREQGQSISICNGAELTVPTFELEAVRPHATFHMRDYIKRGSDLMGAVMHIEVAERERVEGLGVRLAPDASSVA